MAFKYNLQTLLNVKKQFEDSMKNELGVYIAKLNQEQVKLKKIKAEKDRCGEKIVSKCSKGTNIHELYYHRNYFELMNSKVIYQTQSLNSAIDNVESCRKKLIKISQEKKTLEKLKERKSDEYKRNILKEEQKRADELVNYTYSIR